MSEEAQRIAIAEACGWKPEKVSYGTCWTRPTLPLYFAKSSDSLPNYLNDLNAMHEAEDILSPAQSERYAEFMLDVFEMPTPFIGTARCAYLTMHATAAQRAEAFLKTLNLWTP